MSRGLGDVYKRQVIEPLKDMPETITDIHIKDSSFVTSGENRVGCDCLTSEQTTYKIV